MDQFTRIAIDTSKSVFTLHGIDEQGRVFRRELRRAQVEPFFAKLKPAEIAMEACGGAHHWARLFSAQGHRVRLIPPQHVKPFVKRSKNDRNDAAAISEAAKRPDIRPVPVKGAEQQAQHMILSVRDLLVRQRTQAINALRGHAAEFGLAAASQGRGLAALLEAIGTGEALPQAARDMLLFLSEEIAHLQTRIAELDRKLLGLRKLNATARLLETIPGVGPIGAMTLALRVDPAQFRSGRCFAAWIGLTPRERSSGGKRRLGAVTRAGDGRLRNLLVLGATTVIRHAQPGRAGASAWLLGLLERRPRKLAAVALANKMARIVWAMMMSGEAYRRPPQAATA